MGSPSGSRSSSTVRRRVTATELEAIGSYRATVEDVVVAADGAALKALGRRTQRELVGRAFASLVAEPAKRLWQLDQVKGGEKVAAEFTVRLPGGEARTVRDTLRPRLDDSGPFLYGELSEFTEQRRLENRLEELSRRDPLTGCYGKRYLDWRLAQLESQRDWGVLAVLAEATSGRPPSRDLVVTLSRSLQQLIRINDAPISLKGRFFLVVTEEDASALEALTRRLHRALRRVIAVPVAVGWSLRSGLEPPPVTFERARRQAEGFESEREPRMPG